ncbi:MAG: hypothetical protein DCF18_03725 [Cyanobium sp.]|uniref:M28 family peptidase n=1 Tax=Synechococcus sp. CS-1333 TaxID=2848638 RepID=UPI000DBC2326|nr:M28 family peptidase [Synechococcus sp. CS-1333]PZV24126.1 MAG: hypothetical protein DCF18_03725 [Cyanobium sp.]
MDRVDRSEQCLGVAHGYGGRHHRHLVVETDVGEPITVGKFPGQRPELDPLLVASHYDGTLHSIGADDHAPGLAALIELARH